MMMMMMMMMMMQVYKAFVYKASKNFYSGLYVVLVSANNTTMITTAVPSVNGSSKKSSLMLHPLIHGFELNLSIPILYFYNKIIVSFPKMTFCMLDIPKSLS